MEKNFYMNIWRRREPADETEKEPKIFFNIFCFSFSIVHFIKLTISKT